MTILPKKKAEEESDDSDGDNSADGPDESSPHGAAGHAPLSSPNSPEEVGYHHSPDVFYHRRYDLSSSSGESSPELPLLSKRASYRSPPAATASGTRGKKPLDSSPGYNSSEEYDGSHRPYVDPESERQFENALRKDRGLIIKKMRPDGACLFRAVADQIYGDQEMHAVVRNHCMDYMLKNADYFSQYISDEDFDHYINRKRLDQCYGNNIEMQAIAEMYNRPIEVYQYTTDPINIFFGVYKTDNAPIRLSYHGSIHYNSVVDPYKATVGVGLGLAGHKPGIADKTLLVEAQRDSENVHIEQAMLEDKMRSTDWEATYDAIEEAVARESYLTWLRENEKREQPGKHTGSQPSSSACRGTSPPMPSSSSYSPAPQMGNSPVMVTASRKSSSTTGFGNYRSSPSTVHSKSVETKSTNKLRSSTMGHVTGSPSSNPTHHHRGGQRHFTPSPPSGTHHRGGGAGTGPSSIRNAPYYSPRDSGRGVLRGVARNSPTNSPKDSSRSVGGALRGVVKSPSPRSGSGSPVLQGAEHPHSGGGSSSSETSPNRSPALMRKSLVNLNETDPNSHNSSNNHIIASHRGWGSLTPPPPSRTLSLYQTSPTSAHIALSRSPSPLEAPPTSHSPPLPPNQPQSVSQSPPHTLDFEDGRVLSQLPYEYSSFLDLPPSALGLSEWEDDRLLAAVLAASQQEYIDSLRHSRPPGHGAEGHQ